MLKVNDHSIRIKVGEACFALNCLDTDFINHFKSLYKSFLSSESADITIELETLDTVDPTWVSKQTQDVEFFHSDGIFRDSYGLISGKYDLSLKTIRLRVEKSLLSTDYIRLYLNQFVCKVYYSCFKARGIEKLPSFIVHSSAIAYSNHGILFTGPSGIGKTTIAGMCGNKEHTIVINDEGNLVSRPSVTGTPVLVQGIPIIGKIPETKSLTVPLLCGILLKQSNRTVFRKLARTAVFKRLLHQVAGNLYFGQNDLKSAYLSIAEFCEEITRFIPFYELEFSLDEIKLYNTLDALIQSSLQWRGDNV